MSNGTGDEVIDDAVGEMLHGAVTSPEARSLRNFATSRNLGCFGVSLVVLALALLGLGMLNGMFGGEGPGAAAGETALPVIEETAGGAVPPEGTPTQFPSDGAQWVPQDGTWEIENLPFVEECGPGSLGSGFGSGTIEVFDEGLYLVATGSNPGSAPFWLWFHDASGGQLEYLGTESMTGIEMTMVFASPTELRATVRLDGDICMERPAVGTWAREIGEPDPDAEEDEPLPEWMPPSFPVSGSGQASTIETPTSKTVTVVVTDRPPTDVLFSIAVWAVDEGHFILERGATTLTIELPENQLMYVEVLDIGNFNTQLTVTIQDG